MFNRAWATIPNFMNSSTLKTMNTIGRTYVSRWGISKHALPTTITTSWARFSIRFLLMLSTKTC